MTLLIKTAFPVHISTVKFANRKGTAFSPRRGLLFSYLCWISLMFFLCTFFYLLNQVKTPFVNTLILADHKTYQACYYAHYLSFLGDYTLP